jgi:hypothetical protein
MEQFEDGDITRDEYRAKMSDLSKAERDVTKEIAKAEAVQEDIKTRFYSAVSDYADKYPELLDRNGPHIESFDRHVRAVTASNAYAHLSYPDMLKAAHRLYIAESEALGTKFVSLEPVTKTDVEPEPAVKVKAAEKPKKPEPPRTLARVPSAAPVAVSDGRFAAIQQQIEAAQTAEDVERIMASMSPDEQEAFASMDV